MRLTSISSAGQLTLTKEDQNHLRVKPGDRVVMWGTKQAMYIQGLATFKQHPAIPLEQALAMHKAMQRTYGKQYDPALLAPPLREAFIYYQLI